MDFVSSKRTLITIAVTLLVAVSIPVSVYLFKNGYFDIRNEASEGDNTDNTSDTADTQDEGVILEENLMAQWNFNEESEIILFDMTTNENNGTLNGFDKTTSQDESVFSGWTKDNAKIDGALMFDGGDDFVSVADSTSLRPEKITISVWFKTGEDGYLVSKYQDNDDKQGYALIIESDVLSCWVGADEWVSGTTDVTDNMWHNGVCTYDGSSVKVYVDGVLDISKLQEADMSYPAALTIGAFDLGASDNFDGILDCIQLYDVALSEQNILDKLESEDFEYTDVEVSAEDNDDTEEEVSADIDGDGKIGVNDYSLFTTDFNEYKNSGEATTRSDLDSDGDIDMDDYSLFFDEYSL